ncbi:hypothetical protein GmRootV512_53630 [Variovorax sp. V512]
MNDLLHLLDRFLEFSMPHLVAVPILVPMLTAALMLLMNENHRRTKSFSAWSRAWSACWPRSRCCAG